MKKLLSLLLCLVLVLGFVPETGIAASDTFTLMIYMCGTDLESKSGMATADLKEMMAGNIPEGGNVTVFIQTGGTKTWKVNGIENRESQRWTMSKNGMEKLQDLGRVNMGSQETFADFLAYGFKNFPADRYGLIMWDHGTGATGGLCYDEVSGDMLYLPEIYNGLKTGTKSVRKDKPFYFIGFDACLMATFEVACHIEPFAEYMIASEELEPGTGWRYDSWLKLLVRDPGMDMEELGPQIVDSFISATLSANRRDYATLSVIDLSGMDNLKAAVADMGESLSAEIEGGNLSTISRLRQNVRSFGEIYNSASDMVDMTTFAEVYARFDEKSARNLKNALDDMVIYSKHTSNLSGISGLSILVPFSTRYTSSQYMGYYTKMNMYPEYAQFVKDMLNGVSSGSGSFNFGIPSISQQSIQSAEIDWFSQYATDSGSYSSDAYDLWGQLYGSDSDMTSSNQSDFSLGGFLSYLFGGDTSSSTTFDSSYDSSSTSLWGDMDAYSDQSFAQDSGYGSGLWGSMFSDYGAENWNAGNTSSNTIVDTPVATNPPASSSSSSLWDELFGGGEPEATEEPVVTAAPANDDIYSLWGSLFGSEEAEESSQEVTVTTAEGEVTLENPFADANSEYAYTIQLTDEQLQNLGKVEANLMMDMSDPDFECYVELGYVQKVVTDWSSGKIYGMFDGTWATLDGQMVCMYDQIANERYIRSLIPATVNGEEMYILVVFDMENPGGVVVGATEGYTENGNPARNIVELKEGDVVYPQYELIYWDEYGEQQTEPFQLDEPIIAGEDGYIPFSFEKVEEDVDYKYGFCLTDIYGDYTFSDFITLEF